MDEARPTEDGWPDRTRQPGWIKANPVLAGTLGCGCLLAILLAAGIAALSSVVDFAEIPSNETRLQSEVDDDLRARIDAIVGLEPDERILFYYSAGVLRHEEDGNLLTDRRVVTWTEVRGKPDIDQYAWERTVDVTVANEGGFFDDAIYHVHGDDDDLLVLWFAAEEGHHALALEELRLRVAP